MTCRSRRFRRNIHEFIMHEMSVASSMLSIVRDEMTKHQVTHLLLVRVSCGALANVVPEALHFAFEALTAGTDLDGAVLELEIVPLTLRCTACGLVFSPAGREALFEPCPSCGAEFGHHVENGKELFVQHIEAE